MEKQVSPVIPETTLRGRAELTDTEITRCKGAIGSLNWAAAGGRPDLSAAVSIIPASYKDKSPQIITDVNFVVKQALEHRVSIRIWPIAAKDRRYVGFTDSSFDSSGKGRTRKWCLVECTTPGLNLGQEAQCL